MGSSRYGKRRGKSLGKERLHLANTPLDRRHVHDHNRTGASLPRYRQPEIHQPRSQRDGDVSKGLAATERSVLSCARRALLLGKRKRMDGRGNGRTAFGSTGT